MEKIVVRDNNARMRAAAYLAVFGILLLSIPLIVPLVLVYGLERVGSGDIPVLAQLFVTILVEALVIGLALWYVGGLKNFKEILGLQNYSFKPLAIGAGVGLGFFVGLLAVEQLAGLFGVNVENSDTSSLFANLAGLEKIIVLFVFVSFIVPLLEELFFRGYILGFLIRGHEATDKPLKTPIVIWSIVFSSLVFAALHFQGLSSAIDFIVLLWTFIFACAGAVLRLRFTSLYPSIAAHSFYNFCSAVALMFFV